MGDPLVYVLDGLAYTGLFGIVAISLNLEYGFTNIANFGKAAFFMVGAYAYAIAAGAGLPQPIPLLLSMIVTAMVGLIACLPALRLREDYLAISLIALGEIIRLIIKNEEWIAGGVWGISAPSLVTITALSHRTYLYLQLALIYGLLLVCYLISQLVAYSPYGRVLRTIREDEVLAYTLGKNVFMYKAQIVALSSAMTGLSGGLYAQYRNFINPFTFDPLMTFTIWIMVILGGPANNTGAILGSFIVEFFERATRMAKDYLSLPVDPNNLRVILIGLLIILMVAYRPQGILKESPVRWRFPLSGYLKHIKLGMNLRRGRGWHMRS